MNYSRNLSGRIKGRIQTINRKLPAAAASGVLVNLRSTRIVPHDQVAVDLLHQVQGHADDDQQAGAAVEAGDRGS